MNSRAVRAGLWLCSLLAASLLAWASVQVNRERMCTVRDTPELDFCPARDASSESQVSMLRTRLTRNPGDASAYVQLAMADGSSRRQDSIQAAATVAPGEPNILRLLAASALARQEWRQAVGPLVGMLRYPARDEAGRALAQLIALGHGDLLDPYLATAAHWLPGVLWNLSSAKLPEAMGVPVVVRAINLGALSAVEVAPFMGKLKEASAWADAYSLWLALHNQRAPVLFNGGFDQPFEANGFDWEIAPQQPSRSGALIGRVPRPGEGSLLDIRFNGRQLPVPLVRQYLFIGEGRYRISGEYRPTRLRMEQGLAWVVRCTGAGGEAGRSAALLSKVNAWQRFNMDITIPAQCGQVASLQLETFDPIEAATGARGSVSFDNLKLERARP